MCCGLRNSHKKRNVLKNGKNGAIKFKINVFLKTSQASIFRHFSKNCHVLGVCSVVQLITKLHFKMKSRAMHNELKCKKKFKFQMCVWVVAQLPQRLKSMFFEIFSSL